MRYFLLPFLLFCVTASFAAETGYRYVHPDGTVEFSDRPISGGNEIKLREAPVIKLEPPTPSPVVKGVGQKRDSSVGKEGAPVEGGITIISPQPGQTYRFDTSGITVEVRVSPGLQSGQQVSIKLDGKEAASGMGSSFNIGEVYRGTHTLVASVITTSGAVLFNSSPVTFYIRQHSVIKRPPDTSENP